MTLAQHRSRMVNGDVACNSKEFESDPQINRPKQCLCQAMSGMGRPASPADDGPAVICANEGETCACHGRAYYGRKMHGTDILDLKDTVSSVYRASMVEGKIQCSPGGFGGAVSLEV